MTREEAIKTLRELWRETNDSWYEEVFRMAIEALQDRPEGEQTDLISRADAIEAVCKGCHWWSGQCDNDKAFRCDEVCRIEALPSADAEWIPCDTSGMPPEGEEVLVSDGKYIWIDETVAGDATEDGYMMWWGNGSDWIGTAWMPLPKPYKGGDDE